MLAAPAGCGAFETMTPAPYIQANINGSLQSADAPAIAPLNRGFLYGDAIYEVWRTYDGTLFAWQEHWDRLLRSASALYFRLPFSDDEIRREIGRTVGAFREATGFAGEVYVRLQVTRGAGAIGLDTALADRCDFVVLVQRLSLPSAGDLARGLTLSVATGLRRNARDTLNPAWKTGNYLNNLLCLREARARGADEVVILNQAGEITEAAVSNLVFVRDGILITPPLSAGILEGITRHLVLTEVAAAAGVGVREERLTPEMLASMQECFLLSTTRDVMPVRAIDSVNFAVGEGTVAMKIKAAFARHARAYTQKHPELRMP
jgi:branched-chain amino acid aminotransferase